MDQYTVTGMSCAACSARVEKAVSNVPGVTSCSVNLLTNSMGVEGTAEPKTIIKAVKDAGYGAKLKGAEKSADSDDALADRETPLLKKRLIASVIFLVILMYFSGTYDVRLSAAAAAERQSCCNGTYPAAFDYGNNGNQPTLFYKRF